MTAGNSVLMIATEAFGGRGGIATLTRHVALGLSQSAACDGVCVQIRIGGSIQEALPAKISQSRPKRHPVSFAASVCRQALRHRPDLVYCNHVHMAPLALAVAKLTGAGLAIHTHGIEVWGRLSRLQRFAIRRADLVLCASRDTRTKLLRQADIDPHRAVVLNNTFDTQFRPPPAGECDKVSGPFRLLTVSRLDRSDAYKGHDLVIAVVAKLVRQGHDIAYRIVGDGNDKPRLQALAAACGVVNRVDFLGAVPSERLPGLYREADLFVMTSSREGFGIAFLEAMACGTPALGLDAGGARDALGEGELGACVGVEEIESAIEDAMRAPKADAAMLSDAVTARFGQDVFNRRLVAMAFGA